MEFPYNIVGFIVFALFLTVAVNYYNHRNARQKQAHVLSQIPDTTKAIHLDVKSRLSAISPVSFNLVWQRAEVIFIENCIFYFGYFLFPFGLFRMYRGVIQLNVKNAQVRNLLDDRPSYFIETARIEGRKLVITFSRGLNTLLVRRTMTLNVDDSGKLEDIRQILKPALLTP